MVYHLERRRTAHVSKRLTRFILFGAVGFFIFVLWYTADLRAVQNKEIYEKTMQGLKEKDKENAQLGAKMSERLKAADAAKQIPVAKAAPNDESKPKAEEQPYDANAELGSILKKSPVIIFSKTYCPYSKQAKHVLLELYNIQPAPYVVEIDTHPHGPVLQAALAEMTGRRTVPNVMVIGKSIGGGDDIVELDQKGELASTITKLGGKRIESVKKASA